MDFDQKELYRLEQEKLPYYMTYSMQSIYEKEREYQQDMERMHQLYPREARKILRSVGNACDRMEYEGSLMFDEYPDKIGLYSVIKRIYEEMDPEAKEKGKTKKQELWHLIEVMLYQEIYQRRCRRKRCRRWW